MGKREALGKSLIAESINIRKISRLKYICTKIHRENTEDTEKFSEILSYLGLPILFAICFRLYFLRALGVLPVLLTLNIANFFTMLATNGSGFVRRCRSTDLVGGPAAL